MPTSLNHTIVHCADKQVSSQFYAEMLGLPAPESYGPFMVVRLANGAALGFLEEGPVRPQHYAFLVDETEFDEIFQRILDRGLDYWADPLLRQHQRTNSRDGGRGLYWVDLDDHVLEILTVAYGGWCS